MELKGSKTEKNLLKHLRVSHRPEISILILHQSPRKKDMSK